MLRVVKALVRFSRPTFGQDWVQVEGLNHTDSVFMTSFLAMKGKSMIWRTVMDPTRRRQANMPVVLVSLLFFTSSSKPKCVSKTHL